jgi:ABC-2 type transport system ATP-binding protein
MLSVEGVVKRYSPPHPLLRFVVRGASRREITAVDGIDVRVEPGEIVGLVGPNGAGKTTLIKIIAGLVEPTEGRVRVGDTADDLIARRRLLGMVFADERGLYWRLSGRENLAFFGGVYGFSRSIALERASTAMAQVGLDVDDRLVFGYSTGMRAKLSLARALMADPPYLVLDEPSRGLDPVVRADIRTLLRGLADEGRGVLISSHELDDVSVMCDRVVVIVAGRVRFDGPLNELKGETASAALMSLLRDDSNHDG